MGKRSRGESVLPEGWLRDYLGKADLEASYHALRSCTHFHAETMRGRIRSLQVRPEAARKHFVKSLRLSEEVRETIPNLVRKLVLHLFWFENRLLQGPLDGITDVPQLDLPQVPEPLMSQFPEVKYVLNLRRFAEGILRLHLGEFELSASIFSDLIEMNPGEPEDSIASYYLGLAAAQENLGLRPLARRNMENAGFAIQLGGAVLNRAQFAGKLYAFYTCMGDEEGARDWKFFVERLDCPAATKQACLKRGDILIERWSRESKLLLI